MINVVADSRAIGVDELDSLIQERAKKEDFEFE